METLINCLSCAMLDHLNAAWQFSFVCDVLILILFLLHTLKKMRFLIGIDGNVKTWMCNIHGPFNAQNVLYTDKRYILVYFIYII